MKETFSKLLKTGDLQAYNTLFKTHYSRLYNYVFKLSNNKGLTKDIVQEAFIKLWLNRKNIDENLSIDNYLLKICHNEFLMHLRKRQKEEKLIDQLKVETAYELFLSSDHDEKASKIEQVRQAIEQLPPKCKQVFILSKFENMNYKTIAETLGISVKTVENHISKAYKALKKTVLVAYFYIF